MVTQIERTAAEVAARLAAEVAEKAVAKVSCRLEEIATDLFERFNSLDRSFAVHVEQDMASIREVATKGSERLERLENLETTVYRGRDKTPSLVASMQSITEWRERAQFVERGIIGGALKKAGEMVAIAVILGIVLFAKEHLSLPGVHAASTAIEKVAK